MRSNRRLASIGIAVAAVFGDAAAAGSADAQTLRVGIVLGGPASPASRHAAAMASEADAIWRPHGVGVVLASPRDVASGALRLTVTFEPVVRHPDRVEALGAIWFDDDGRPGQAIAIDRAAVAARIRQPGAATRALDAWPSSFADVITARALGRVLAHEIGHFLLASPTHAREGLMRASFDGRQLSDWSRLAFKLDDMALPRLRARIARLESAEEPLVASAR
jgi:hypothetical protein